MKLAKKAAVKSSDYTPITYLLSAVCNFMVFTRQELALSKVPVVPHILLMKSYKRETRAERKYLTGLVQSDKCIEAFCFTHYA